MSRHRIAAGTIALVAIVGLSAVARAGSPVAPKAGEASAVESGTPMDATVNATAEAKARADADAKARADLEALKARIEEKAAKATTAARAKADRDIAESQKQVESSAAIDGDERIAARLGEEFGMTAEALLTQKAALETSWGQLLVAHSIAANAATDVTVEQLIAMKRDGMGWGKIAAGLDLQLGSVVSGIKSEGQVARGTMRGDGRVTAMSGPGARAGLGVNAGVGAGLAKGRSTTNAGVGVGVKIKP